MPTGHLEQELRIILEFAQLAHLQTAYALDVLELAIQKIEGLQESKKR